MSSERILLWLLVFVIAAGMVPMTEAWTRTYYTAAVFEHARQGDFTNWTSEKIVEENLALYRKAAEVARKKGVDLILFPEYGIFPASADRNFLKPFLENIPDPKKACVNPCKEALAYSTKPILYSLSCMAKENSMVVIANTGDSQPCEGHPKCPEDGVFQFNTNVVFDKNGTLVARYYKERLYFEGGMDLPVEEQDPTFKTEFGTFATFVCFDIIFKKMSDYALKPEIDGIMFSLMWINSSPLFTSVPLLESFATGHNTTLLAANLQIPGLFNSGSGMFKGQHGTLAYTFNPDGISKLVVTRIPRSSRFRYNPFGHSYTITALTKNSSFTTYPSAMPDVCSWQVLGDARNIYKDYRCYDGNTTFYTLTKLTKSKGRVEACNNGFCCSVDYSAISMEEDFYLGVFNGTSIPYLRYPWAEENCFLARCDEFEGRPCATFPMNSKTAFHRVRMTAKFSTSVVWPTVAKYNMLPVDKDEWSYGTIQNNAYRKVIDFESSYGQRLLVVGMKARNYERDPPYVR